MQFIVSEAKIDIISSDDDRWVRRSDIIAWLLACGRESHPSFQPIMSAMAERLASAKKTE